MNDSMNTEEMECLLERVARHYEALFARVFPPGTDMRRVAGEFLSLERAAEQVSLLESQLPFGLAGRRLLEVGSAYGTLLEAARAAGAEAFGVEPAPEEFSGTIDGCREHLRLLGAPLCVAAAEGEAIPFRNGVFDVVTSWNVLEHVQDLDLVLSEIVRVLAPGGCAVLIVPNYGSWWEGHYGMLWPPHIPKSLAKLYVRLFGRDAGFIDTLQFVTVGRLRKALAPHLAQVEVLSWGREVWQRRLTELDMSEWASLARLKRVVTLLHRLRLQHFLAWLGARLNWQTPIILVLRKR